MITLGGVTLNPDMIWSQRHTSQAVAQSTRRTLGGSMVVFSGQLSKGAAITLASGEPNGVLIGICKKSVVDALLAQAVIAGATYALHFHGTDYDVIYDHPDAVVFEPIRAQLSYGANDLMRGSIKLLTI